MCTYCDVDSLRKEDQLLCKSATITMLTRVLKRKSKNGVLVRKPYLTAECNGDVVTFEIKYCPMCGREL